jgi:hypothetical protein
MSSNPPPRLHFGRGIAAEHVTGLTYRWVDPVNGAHRGYVVALQVDYLPTLEAQRAYKGNK